MLPKLVVSQACCAPSLQRAIDIPDDFSLSGGVERVSTLSELFDQGAGQITASNVQALDGMGQRESLVNRNNVRKAITRIENNASGATRGIEGQNRLNGDIESGYVEGLEHDLGHLLPVGLGVHRSFGEKNGVLLRSDTKFVVEGVVSDLFHIIPIGYDTMLDGILESQYTTLGLGLVALSEISGWDYLDMETYPT